MIARLHQIFQVAKRRIRWALGFGWSAAEFNQRYANKPKDAWGYDQSPAHSQRIEAIFRCWPDQPIDSALEVGCAEGFITQRLAQHVGSLTACDLSEAAVNRTRENCKDLANVNAIVADVRKQIPVESVELALFSDVLYYFSETEISQTLDRISRVLTESGYLLFANEWNDEYKNLTPPEKILELFDQHECFQRETLLQESLGDSGYLTVALFRKTDELQS